MKAPALAPVFVLLLGGFVSPVGAGGLHAQGPIPNGMGVKAGQDWSPMINIAPPPERADRPAPAGPAPEEGDRPPRVLVAIRPSYPPAYARKGIQGAVLVDFDVDEYGFVMNAKVVDSPDPRLSDAAEAAVREWRFLPGIRDGRPAVSHMRVPLLFSSSPADARSDPEAAADQARVRGEEALARHDYEAATTAFAGAFLLAPHSPDIVYDRGLASLARGWTGVALADFKEALRLDPDDARFHLACGQAYAGRGDYRQAIAACDDAIRLAPDSATA